MEPMIYKPSIYKGEGIYKVGAEGGDIPNKIHQDFVYKNILGKWYKCVEISDKVFFPVQNLDYIDENIVHTSDFSQESGAACAYYDYAQTSNRGFFYNNLARKYIDSIKTSQMKNLDGNYFNLLINYLERILETWLGKNTHPSHSLLTTLSKNIEFDIYEEWLGLIDIGLGVYGYYENGFGKIPTGYNKPVYCGFASKELYGGFIEIYQGKELVYHSGTIGYVCYPMRFIIDES